MAKETYTATWGVGGTEPDQNVGDPKALEKVDDVQDVSEDTKPTKQAEKTPKSKNTVEDEARAMGWRPKDEWDGEESDWVDAKEFVGRAPLYEGLSKSNKKIKNLEQSIDLLKEHFAQIQKGLEAKQAEEIKALKERLKEAAKVGDSNEVEKLHNEILDRSNESKNNQPPPNTTNQAFEEWLEDNQWYIKEPKMQRYADRIARSIAAENQDGSGALKIPPQALYEEVADEVRARFPEYFEPKRKATTKVGTNSGRQPSEASEADVSMLTEAQKIVMKQLVNANVLTEAEYIKQLKEANFLQN